MHCPHMTHVSVTASLRGKKTRKKKNGIKKCAIEYNNAYIDQDRRVNNVVHDPNHDKRVVEF